MEEGVAARGLGYGDLAFLKGKSEVGIRIDGLHAEGDQEPFKIGS